MIRTGVVFLALIGLDQGSAHAENMVTASAFTCTAGTTTISGSSPCALDDVSSTNSFSVSVAGNTVSYSSFLTVGDVVNTVPGSPYPESATGQYGDVYHVPGPVGPANPNVWKISLYFDVDSSLNAGNPNAPGDFVSQDLTLHLGPGITYDLNSGTGPYADCYGTIGCHLNLTSPADFDYISLIENASVGVNVGVGDGAGIDEEAIVTISQFAPNGVTPVSFVPEPKTALLVAPFLLILAGWFYQRRRSGDRRSAAPLVIDSIYRIVGSN